MRPISTLARPLVATSFVITGLETLRDPRLRAEQVAPAIKPFTDRLDWLPTKDPEALVRIQGAISVGAGTMLALGRFRRLSALLLAAELVPAVLTEHRYWTEDDPERRTNERSHLLKNASLLGALLMVATEPRRRRRRPVHDARIKAGAELKHARKRVAKAGRR